MYINVCIYVHFYFFTLSSRIVYKIKKFYKTTNSLYILYYLQFRLFVSKTTKCFLMKRRSKVQEGECSYKPQSTYI